MSFKMAAKFVLLASTFILISVVASETEDYYWRNFNGTILDDAIIGCTNFGFNEYIGRGAIKNGGYFIGPILPGTNAIVINYLSQTTTIDDHLQILCSDKTSNFEWVLTNSSSVVSLPGLIEAGYNFTDLTNYYIGRIALNEEECALGYVNQYYDYEIYYVNGTDAYTSTTHFQVLTNSS